MSISDDNVTYGWVFVCVVTILTFANAFVNTI